MIRDTFKKILWGTQAWRLFRCANRHRIPIAMYHGVTDRIGCLDWTQIHVDQFERHIAYMAEQYNLVSVTEVLQMLKEGHVPPGTAALTFDDGYETFRSLTLPVLRKYDVPAILFVCTDFISNGDVREKYLWPDYISALLSSGSCKSIDLQDIGLGRYNLTTPSAFNYSRNLLINRLKLIDGSYIERAQEKIKQKCGSEVDHEQFRMYHPMTWAELKEVSRDPLVSIGAHTRRHPILSRLRADQLAQEVIGSKEDLEKQLEMPIQDFAYPNGRIIDINLASVTLVREHFRSAFTSVWGLNDSDQDRYLLKRIGVAGTTTLHELQLLLCGVLNIPDSRITMEDIVRVENRYA